MKISAHSGKLMERPSRADELFGERDDERRQKDIFSA
jgi:hypothetical protein